MLKVLKVRGMPSEILSPSILRLDLRSLSWRFRSSRDGLVRRVLALESWYYRSHAGVFVMSDEY
jgi:hypothetical protein